MTENVHKTCKHCGVRLTVATASGIAEDPAVRDSFCTGSRYGSHTFVAEAPLGGGGRA